MVKLIVNKIGHVSRNLLQETADDIVGKTEGAHQHAPFDRIEQTHHRSVAGQLTIEFEVPQTLMNSRKGGDEQILVDLADDGVFGVACFNEEATNGRTIRTQIFPETEVRFVDEDFPGGIPTGSRANHQGSEGMVEQLVAVVPSRVQARLADSGLGGDLRQIEARPSCLPIKIKGSAKDAFLHLRVTRSARFSGIENRKTRQCAHSFREGVTGN